MYNYIYCPFPTPPTPTISPTVFQSQPLIKLCSRKVFSSLSLPSRHSNPLDLDFLLKCFGNIPSSLSLISLYCFALSSLVCKESITKITCQSVYRRETKMSSYQKSITISCLILQTHWSCLCCLRSQKLIKQSTN